MKYRIGQRVKVTSGVFMGECGTIREECRTHYFLHFENRLLVNIDQIRFYDNELELCESGKPITVTPQ